MNAENEGLIANVSPQEEEQSPNPEETVVPHIEEENKTVEQAKAEEEKVTLEKPEYLEDKFWDPEKGVKTEELNHSYKELQKQFSMGKHKAPKEYDLEVLEDVDVDNDELAQFFMDWTSKYKPTQGAFNELVSKFKELSVAQEQEDSIDVAAEKQQLGPNADQIVKGTVTWMQGLVAKGIWSETDFEEGKIFTATADGINAINKIRRYYGEQTIPTAPTDVDGQPSREELFALVADPKYKTDPGFRAKVEKQFERAFPGTATSTGEI